MDRVQNLVSLMLILLGLSIVSSGCQRLVSDEYELLHNGRNAYRDLAWSPDGERISFVLKPNTQFVLLDLKDGNEISLPVEIEGISGPSTLHWPTDNEISYSLSFREPSGRPISELSLLDIEQGESRLLFSGERIFKACWSRAAQAYIFVARRPASSDQSYYGNTLLIYDPQDETLASLFRAPLDRSIIDISCEQSQGLVAIVVGGTGSARSVYSLFVLDIENPTSETVWETSQMRFDSPTWSPTGDWIAVRSLEGRPGSPLPGIMLISADGNETQVVMGPNSSFSPVEVAWSPIDNRLLFTTGQGLGGYALYMLDLTPLLGE